MIQFPSGFIITSNESIDCRFVLSSEEMLNISIAIRDNVGGESVKDYNMPDTYFCVSSDDGRIYHFYCEDPAAPDKHNEWQAKTGYFRVSEYRLDEALTEEVARAIASEHDIDERALHKSFAGEPVVEEVDGKKVWLADQEYRGDIDAAGKATIDSGADIGGELKLNGNLNVTGKTHLDGRVTIEADDAESEESVDITGSVHIDGFTDIDRDLGVDGTITSGNNAIFKKDISVAQNACIEGNLSAGGDITTAGALEVRGATALNSTLSVTGATILHDALTIDDNKATILGGTLEAKGNTQLDGDLHVNGDTYIAGQHLDVNSKTGIKGQVTINASEQGEFVKIIGATMIEGNADIDGSLGLTEQLSVADNAEFEKDVSIGENITIGGDITADGNITTGNAVYASKVAADSVVSAAEVEAEDALYIKGQKTPTGVENALKINSSGEVEKVDLTVASPTKNGKTLEYIDTISQDSVGKISATKKEITLADGGQGTLTLNDSNITITNLTVSGKPTFAGVVLGSAEPALNEATPRSYVDAVDDDLQTQIDAITSKSDVVDVVSCYDNHGEQESDITHYDTTVLFPKDVIKVLKDETHENAVSYYRYLPESAAVNHFEYIGSVEAYYTKAETDAIIDGLDCGQIGENGKYIKYVSEANGVVSATTQPFDTAIGSGSTDNNAPTSRAVKSYVDVADALKLDKDNFG